MTTMVQGNLERNQRLAWMDAAKGIGIFLVVYAHAKAPFNQYMYLFHMPLFFFLSGYLYNPKGSFRDFLVRKMKSLYIPFVGWNIIVIVLLLTPRFLKGELTGQLILYYLKRCGKILLTVDWEGSYLGASWFLGALFIVSVVYKFLDYYIEGGEVQEILYHSALYRCRYGILLPGATVCVEPGGHVGNVLRIGVCSPLPLG